MTELKKFKMGNLKGPQGNSAVVRGKINAATDLPSPILDNTTYTVGDSNTIFIYEVYKWVQYYPLIGHVDTSANLPTGTENDMYSVGTDNLVYLYTENAWTPLYAITEHVSAISDLPSLREGDLYVVGDDCILYSYSGGAWVNCGTIKGMQGIQGETGHSQIGIAIVNELPTTGDPTTIYFIKQSDVAGDNIYDEYIWVDTKFEKFGQAKIDLSNYYTKTEIDTLFTGYYNKDYIDNNIKTTLTDIITRLGV